MLGIHGAIAAAFDAEEFILSPEETKQLSASITRVTDLYVDVALSPAQQAWGGLIFTLGTMYGPRYIAMLNRRKAEAAEATKTPAPSPVAVVPAPAPERRM